MISTSSKISILSKWFGFQGWRWPPFTPVSPMFKVCNGQLTFRGKGGGEGRYSNRAKKLAGEKITNSCGGSCTNSLFIIYIALQWVIEKMLQGLDCYKIAGWSREKCQYWSNPDKKSHLSMESILVQKRTRFDFEQIRIRPLNNINVNYLPFGKQRSSFANKCF